MWWFVTAPCGGVPTPADSNTASVSLVVAAATMCPAAIVNDPDRRFRDGLRHLFQVDSKPPIFRLLETIAVTVLDPMQTEVCRRQPNRFGWVLAMVGFVVTCVSASVRDGSTARWDVSTTLPVTLVQDPGERDVRPNGFDLSESLVPVEQVLRGGPPKDGIAALTDPVVLTVEQADAMRDVDRVIGVAIGGMARAYPIAILNYHEIINDQLGDHAIAVTFCPLCDSAVVVDRHIGSRSIEFGVSGLLFNSNVLMYDRRVSNPSLWSQLDLRAISGPMAGTRLVPVRHDLVRWKQWIGRHPQSTVVSIRSADPDRIGRRRDYTVNPYEAYLRRPGLMFSVNPAAMVLPASDLKSLVLGVTANGKAGFVTADAFGNRASSRRFQLAGASLIVNFDPVVRQFRVTQADPAVSWTHSFRFAWQAFHPTSEALRPSREGSPNR
ncbi:hypothetical protein V7x_15750 [Crateriforma conspicua]|uniref:DUF3179 domain-containing protein n=1 Tax=Crateriforma conspicua TaxID=2527996 RepID=A0A5C6FT05_9PLAN|nr:hypothetical protein V7x_15750 [Crateriforma conspicua]